jgi:transposase
MRERISRIVRKLPAVSAGKRRSGKTRRGNRWIRTALVEAGGAAGRPKRTALGARYRRLRGHVGHGRAVLG